MFSTTLIVFIALIYTCILFSGFWLARNGVIAEPWHSRLFSLSLGIHCTSWAMLGTVSQAVNYGWALIPTYAGIMITMLFAIGSVKRLSMICSEHNIASIADFMALRWPKDAFFPGLVAFVLCISIIPYIALQLMALVQVSTLLLVESPNYLAFIISLLLGGIGWLFGSNRYNLSVKQLSLIYLSAVNSIVKVVAILGVAIAVIFVLFDGVFDLLNQALQHEQAQLSLGNSLKKAEIGQWLNYACFMLFGVVSVFCLPRQFHIAFVANRNPEIFNKVKWQFPLYLVLMSIGVLPIALAGQMLFSPEFISSDLYTVAIPLYYNMPWVSVLIILGVLSAAIPMILISTLALTTTVANNLASPILIKVLLKKTDGQPARLSSNSITRLRRIIMLLLLGAAFWFYSAVAIDNNLVFSGFISLAFVTQLFPSFVIIFSRATVNVIAPIVSIAFGSLAMGILVFYPQWIESFNIAQGSFSQSIFVLTITAINAFILVLTNGLATLFWPQFNAKPISFKREDLVTVDSHNLIELCEKLLSKEELVPVYASSGDNLTSVASTALANRLGQASTQMIMNALSRPERTADEVALLAKQSQIEMQRTIDARTLKLDAAKRLAEAESESKTRFLAAAGHDLMQPFNAAQLLANILNERTQNTELNEISHDLTYALEHAETLLKSLLDMAKLDSGVISPNLQKTALDKIIAPLLKEFQIIAQEQNVTLRYVPTSLWVKSDPQLLLRIIQNLLGNAIRYSGVVNSPKVLIGVKRQHGKHYLYIIDNGPGMTPTQQTLMYEEFTRFNTDDRRGLGLGLNIVKRLADLLALSIDVKSTLDKGTAFFIELPIVAPSPIAATVAVQPIPKLAKHTVWLLENEPEVASAMLHLLTHWELETKWFNTPNKLFAAFDSGERCDVLIIDYHLDNGELGTDVWQSLQTKCFDQSANAPSQALPTGILLTADKTQQIRQKAEDLDLVYFAKPLKSIALKRFLNQL